MRAFFYLDVTDEEFAIRVGGTGAWTIWPGYGNRDAENVYLGREGEPSNRSGSCRVHSEQGEVVAF